MNRLREVFPQAKEERRLFLLENAILVTEVNKACAISLKFRYKCLDFLHIVLCRYTTYSYYSLAGLVERDLKGLTEKEKQLLVRFRKFIIEQDFEYVFELYNDIIGRRTFRKILRDNLTKRFKDA